MGSKKKTQKNEETGIEPMTFCVLTRGFTTALGSLLLLWGPTKLFYGVHRQFYIPFLVLFKKRLGSGDPVPRNVGPPLLVRWLLLTPSKT
ncbi:hypothetical protein HanIR_Chr07g0337581 [Helianthus annuus]|nr:hypothetical protein HanIR_Chr07g0337581 [Helianthus annuus]